MNLFFKTSACGGGSFLVIASSLAIVEIFGGDNSTFYFHLIGISLGWTMAAIECCKSHNCKDCNLRHIDVDVKLHVPEEQFAK